jgi:hypothetical protein
VVLIVTANAVRLAVIEVCAAVLVAALACATGPVQAACRPDLSVTDVRFSDVRGSTQTRRWSARVLVDPARCATQTGRFEIGILRQKEPGSEVEFHERFTWSAPAVEVAIDLWEDEAVEAYWINSSVCPCARDGAGVADGRFEP